MDELDVQTLGIAAGIAWVIPLIVSLLKRASFPPIVNMALAFAASFAVATIAVLVSGEVDFSNGYQNPELWLAAAGLAFAESQVIYRLIIKGTTAGERVNEAITTFPFSPPAETTPLGDTLAEDVIEGPPL